MLEKENKIIFWYGVHTNFYYLLKEVSKEKNMGNTKPYTLDNVPLRNFHIRVLTYTIGGSLSDGYILGMIQFALLAFTADVGMNATWQGLITSSPLAGVFIGGLIFGDLSDKIGRQKIYSLDFVAILVLSILQFFVNTAGTLFFLRLLLGICIGAEYAISPAIVAEFVPSKLRGRILAILCMVWTIGYVIAAYVGAWLQTTGPESWRWMLSSSAIIAFIVLIIRIGMPETPRWLILQNKIDEAREVVAKHLGEDIDLDPTIEEINNRKPERKATILALFAKGQIKRTAFATIAYGVNVLPLYAVLSFVPIILKALGIVDENTFYTLLLNGLYMLAGIIVLFIVDRFPRKKVTVWGMVVAIIPLLILGFWTGAPAGVIIACFGIHILGNQTFGTITAYIYPTEAFPTVLRTTGAGFTSAVSRIFACFGTFAMPIIIANYGIEVALIGIAVFLILGLVVTLAWAPETGNKSVDEL